MRDLHDGAASGAGGRRGQLLMLALVALMAPALVLGSAVINAGRQDAGAIEAPARVDVRIEQTVSAAGWHPAIEHGLGPIGPAPGASLGERPSR